MISQARKSLLGHNHMRCFRNNIGHDTTRKGSSINDSHHNIHYLAKFHYPVNRPCILHNHNWLRWKYSWLDWIISTTIEPCLFKQTALRINSQSKIDNKINQLPKAYQKISLQHNRVYQKRKYGVQTKSTQLKSWN